MEVMRSTGASSGALAAALQDEDDRVIQTGSQNVAWAWNNRTPAWPVNTTDPNWYLRHSASERSHIATIMVNSACAGARMPSSPPPSPL